jgi:Tat protein secretion system quality control protein TatD with DNase activity
MPSAKGRALVARMPQDRVLTETDRTICQGRKLTRYSSGGEGHSRASGRSLGTPAR